MLKSSKAAATEWIGWPVTGPRSRTTGLRRDQARNHLIAFLQALNHFGGHTVSDPGADPSRLQFNFAVLTCQQINRARPSAFWPRLGRSGNCRSALITAWAPL